MLDKVIRLLQASLFMHNFPRGKVEDQKVPFTDRMENLEKNSPQ